MSYSYKFFFSDLFKIDSISSTRTAKLTLLDDDNDIIPTVLESEDTTKESLFAEIEDNSELLEWVIMAFVNDKSSLQYYVYI